MEGGSVMEKAHWAALGPSDGRMRAAVGRLGMAERAFERGEVVDARYHARQGMEILGEPETPEGRRLFWALSALREGRKPPSGLLGIDPATHIGACWLDPSGKLVTERVNATPDRGENSAMRFAHFADGLRALLRLSGAEFVVFLQLNAMRNAKTARLLAGYEALVYLVCEEVGVGCLSVPEATVKKWATGNGHATKEEMTAAAVERFGAGEGISDDEGDACCVWAWGMANAQVTGGA